MGPFSAPLKRKWKFLARKYVNKTSWTARLVSSSVSFVMGCIVVVVAVVVCGEYVTIP